MNGGSTTIAGEGLRPRNMAYMREYYQRPDVKISKNREYHREY